MKKVLIQRFVQMIERTLLAAVENNTATTTGRNLRCIMLLTQKNSVEEMVVSDIRNAVYQKVDVERQWQVELIELLLLEREQEGLEDSDLEWLEWLCTD